MQAGDTAELLPYAGEAVSGIELFRDHYRREKDAETLRRFLRAPIAVRVRADLEKDLEKISTVGSEVGKPVNGQSEKNGKRAAKESFASRLFRTVSKQWNSGYGSG